MLRLFVHIFSILCFLWSPFVEAADDIPSKPILPKRILLGSPIRQKPEILQEFLASLNELDLQGIQLDFYFVDDNEDTASKELLQKFCAQKTSPTHCLVIVPPKPAQSTAPTAYVCNETTHYWKEELVWKVADFKNKMLEQALADRYDYLFLIDSDLILHPHTLHALLEADKEIVSNIFWTRWVENASPLPQVWLTDHYTQYAVDIGETLSAEEIAKRHQQFIHMLQQKGTYEVGGLGACTLIRASALQKGVSFKRIKNVTFWGEDRHFCIRASALGIDLFVDTHYPAYHLYRVSNVSGIADFKAGKRLF